MATIVSAPSDLVIAVSDGIPVLFAGADVEATSWDGKAGIRVSVAGVRGPETMQRDATFRTAQAAWARRLKEHGKAAAGDPPTMPGVPALSRVKVNVTDDVGTRYEFVAGQVAGDGSEWDASWIYAPRPPAVARELRLEFTLDAEPTGRDCKLTLQ